MSAFPLAGSLALLAALLLRAVLRQRPGVLGWLTTLAAAAFLAPLSFAIATPTPMTPLRAALCAALGLALLARDRVDVLQSESALKLTWVLAAAFALSWAGGSLLTLAAGTATPHEQWPALALELDPYALWSAALSLTLLAGFVLLGGAPFHFWLADIFHGARAWMAPLIAAALQTAGAALLLARLAGLTGFPAAEQLVRGDLVAASVVALAGGAAALAWVRRPERRVGLLASLQGGLMLAALVAAPGGTALPLARWAAHLALALTGAGALARFLPVGASDAEPAAVLFRRHPWTGAAGLYALLSLAGVPGTPGMALWLGVARALARTHHAGVLAALVLAWLAAFAAATGEARRAFGSPSDLPLPERGVPWPAQAALWLTAAALVAQWPGSPLP